jgi:hypothetical protein
VRVLASLKSGGGIRYQIFSVKIRFVQSQSAVVCYVSICWSNNDGVGPLSEVYSAPIWADPF